MAALTDDEIRYRLGIIRAHGLTDKAAGKCKVTIGGLRATLRMAKARDISLPPEPEIEFPDLPPSELSPDKLIEQAAARFEVHRAARDARRWMEIKINTKQPIGLALVGDPHIDNNGCNWPLLRRDIGIFEKTPGLYACNLGDLTDNWVGRLIRLYADQEMSKKQAWKLAKYFLRDTKIKWLCHLLGNHDAWNDGPYLIKANAVPVVPVEDWQSRFQIVFSNNARVRIHAAHDFPGNSIWNDMHGPLKASMLREQADIYACGHKHMWGLVQGENANRGFIYHLVRARGYKAIDQYAENLGYGSQQFGATITAIIDPVGQGPNKIRCFADLEEAAEFLNWKRARA